MAEIQGDDGDDTDESDTDDYHVSNMRFKFQSRMGAASILTIFSYSGNLLVVTNF